MEELIQKARFYIKNIPPNQARYLTIPIYLLFSKLRIGRREEGEGEEK